MNTKNGPQNPWQKMQAERDALVARSRATAEAVKASGQANLSPEQLKQINGDLARVDEIDAELAKVKKADEVWERLGRFGDPDLSGTKGAGMLWAKSVADKLRESAEGHGVKALLTGEVSTPPSVDVTPLPDKPTRMLELVPRKVLESATWAYLRQTVRTNNAAAVADGSSKPTSIYTFTEIEDRARVIAHLSEPFPIRFTQDHESMIDMLQAQLMTGIWEAIEDLIVNGDGTTGDEWTGILAVDGTTEVGYDTDMITTLRKARTALEVKGERVTGVALNPSDAEVLDMTREDGSTGGFLLDGSAYERIFGAGVTGVTSLAVPAGTALLGDWSTTLLRIRQNEHTLAATQSGDLFDKNQMKLRTEGRFGFEIRRPQALAVVELEDAG